ncbi:hypothetical protein GCM10009838_27050 [Catenulispora subtropica]|uniref:GH18 domain-containing protein n=1 Tax=Catenulispora subtropica TaxID=450798 RepID=A0ABN2RDF3_9ACTN
MLSRVRPRRKSLFACLSALMLAVTGLSGTARAATKTGPISVAYIEVNSNSMLNVGKYTLAGNGANVFDIGVIFAANINYDGSNAYLSFNPQVQSVLDNAATQIKPLQQQGIKVELSILGNHQGAGFANFPSQAAASAFAKQLSDAVTTYGLDGIDFDDEYADYGVNGTAQPNASSFVYLVQALRADMPGKLITLYDIGPSASALSYNGVDVTSDFDYAWNPWYGSFSVPSIALPKSRLAPAAVDFGSTSASTATSLAQQTVSGGYGAYLTYNLTSTDIHDYISGFTNVLYGSGAVYGSTSPPPNNQIVNGGFETGDLSSWTTSGAGSSIVSSGAHSGAYAARLGGTTPTNGDSSAAQSFTAPSGSSKVSFWYNVTCPDTVTYDWATATLRDNTAGTTTTVLAKTCVSSSGWKQVTASITAGHSYTLTLTSHDDNYAGDPTYTLFDDVAAS